MLHIGFIWLQIQSNYRMWRALDTNHSSACIFSYLNEEFYATSLSKWIESSLGLDSNVRT